jgi:hypothetical protein
LLRLIAPGRENAEKVAGMVNRHVEKSLSEANPYALVAAAAAE